MPSQTWLDANDIDYNYLKPNAFRLVLHNMPKVSYFCQTANLPGIQLDSATQPTPFYQVPHSGTEALHDDLHITFLVDAHLRNFGELYNWIKSIGMPEDNQQFIDWKYANVNKSLTKRTDESGIECDATLHVLTAKGNPSILVALKGVWPSQLASLDFDAAITD